MIQWMLLRFIFLRLRKAERERERAMWKKMPAVPAWFCEVSPCPACWAPSPWHRKAPERKPFQSPYTLSRQCKHTECMPMAQIVKKQLKMQVHQLKYNQRLVRNRKTIKIQKGKKKNKAKSPAVMFQVFGGLKSGSVLV